MVRPRTASARRNADAFELPMWEPGVPCEAVLFIDPGAVNCGMAWMSFKNDTWTVEDAWKLGPMACLHFIKDSVESWETPPLVVGVEAFRLRPDKASEQGFSAMGTPQVIGAIMWEVARTNVVRRDLNIEPVHFVLQQPNVRFHGCEVLDGACVRIRGKGIKHDPTVHVGPNVHARDAEAHAVFFVAKKVGAIQQMRLPGLVGS